MEIKYVGPKAMISEHGVSFKDGKDDKYVYINDAMQIFKAINHTYKKDMQYQHDIDASDYTAHEIFAILKTHVQAFEQIVQGELVEYRKYLQAEEHAVENRLNLNKDEKLVFLNNLKIMRDYREQRFINKHVYEHIIKAITDQIIEQKLHEIETPFNERFWHILQTIEGWLSSEHNISSNLNTYHKEELIIIRLDIQKIY